MKVVSKAKHVWMIYSPDGSYEIIYPGVNLKVNESVLKHPDFVKRQELGLIEISGPVSDFKQMGTKELLSDIKQLYDVKALERILAEDERLAVQKAAQDQLDEIRKEDTKSSGKGKKKVADDN